jgi:maleylpyruvate isomerase
VTSRLSDFRGWAAYGTNLVLANLDEAALAAPSGLPGWSRRHLLAHLGANADALGNLVHWAATGEPTPMYASSAERAAGVERGARLPAAELTAWLHGSAEALSAAMDGLSDEQWQALVVTAQGRTVPRIEVPWLRARETCVHAVDLALGVTFADLSEDFLRALCADVTAKRRGCLIHARPARRG